MKRTPLTALPDWIPESLRHLCYGAAVYDSSCSPEARVIYIDRDCGYFLKTSARGSLSREAAMASYFHKKGLTARVCEYVSADRDFLLTERVPGEDATAQKYLSDPHRLAEAAGQMLRELHETDFTDCPVMKRMESYLDLARVNLEQGRFDLSYGDFPSAKEAYATLTEAAPYFRNDTLIHGDFCLPNFLMRDWRLSGFIDLGNGGVGDRHVDLFWGAWTLNFNLGTDKYRNVFFDAYGRDRIEPDLIRAVSAAEVFG